MNETIKVSWPKISIVTPSYNQAQFLETTICSVLDQAYPNLEYIIMDGGSTDGSVEIIKKHEKHLTYWCSQKDQGQYFAVNAGFKRSTGEVMAWINSDDIYCPWALRTIGSIFRELKEVRWVTTLNQLAWNKDGYCTLVKPFRGYSPKAFADGENVKVGSARSGFIQQESTFWRRSLWEEVGGLDTSFSLAADFNLWACFFERACLYGSVSPLAGFRVHSTNRSLDRVSYLREANDSLARFRERNPGYTNQFRRLTRELFDKLPKVGKVLKTYSAVNIIRSNSEDGDEWVVCESKF